jgi:hypothetical protein
MNVRRAKSIRYASRICKATACLGDVSNKYMQRAVTVHPSTQNQARYAQLSIILMQANNKHS